MELTYYNQTFTWEDVRLCIEPFRWCIGVDNISQFVIEFHIPIILALTMVCFHQMYVSYYAWNEMKALWQVQVTLILELYTHWWYWAMYIGYLSITNVFIKNSQLFTK